MLISYPFLSAATLHDNEDRYLANMIETHLLPNEGQFPVSTLRTTAGDQPRWHGGIHLRGGGEPVRAIADGTVVAFRFAAQSQTYGALGAVDAGFVLLRHETLAGANTPVVFHSLYMHLAHQDSMAADRLAQLPRWIREQPGPDVRRPVRQRVWRKDVLGFVGELYRHEAMHFEVFMLDADFRRVWRDSRLTSSGMGTDDWFGDAHFVLPAGQTFVARHPRAASRGPHRILLPGGEAFPLPEGSAGQSQAELFVSVSLQRGQRVAWTRQVKEGGGYERVGSPVVQPEYEHELFRLAAALYPDCPSAGMEWLRFGRVLGPDRSTREENWQLVRYGDTAVGYVDLASAGIGRFSDADFPHWLGWTARDEGEAVNASDGLCDDPGTLAQVQSAAVSPAAAQDLQFLVCKSPSEWDDSDLEIRYARLREPGQPLSSPNDWDRFQEHVAQLAFWRQAGLPERSVWHFHPLRFIWHFRRCTWLTDLELAQALPRHRPSRLTWESASRRARSNLISINVLIRKYLGNDKKRWAHALAQVFLETDLLNTLSEYGLGAGHAYGAFHGRGLLQLTWACNYASYGKFRAFSNHEGVYADRRVTARSVHPWDSGGAGVRWHPRYDPSLVGSDEYSAGDSAGYFWVSKTFRAYRNINRASDLGVSPGVVGYISWLINGGGNGYRERQMYFSFIANELLDNPRKAGSEVLRFPALSHALTQAFPPGNVALDDSVEVSFDRQIP